MKYYENFSQQSDPRRLAEMLALQEANQRIDTSYGALPSMSGDQSIDPMALMQMKEKGEEMRLKRTAAKAKKVGKNTFDTTNPFDTGGLA